MGLTRAVLVRSHFNTDLLVLAACRPQSMLNKDCMWHVLSVLTV